MKLLHKSLLFHKNIGEQCDRKVSFRMPSWKLCGVSSGVWSGTVSERLQSVCLGGWAVECLEGQQCRSERELWGRCTDEES